MGLAARAAAGLLATVLLVQHSLEAKAQRPSPSLELPHDPAAAGLFMAARLPAEPLGKNTKCDCLCC